jgi:hypothetical protein
MAQTRFTTHLAVQFVFGRCALCWGGAAPPQTSPLVGAPQASQFAQIALKPQPMTPKMVPETPRYPQDGYKMASKWVDMVPWWPQEWSQNTAKMAQTQLQNAPCKPHSSWQMAQTRLHNTPCKTPSFWPMFIVHSSSRIAQTRLHNTPC